MHQNYIGLDVITGALQRSPDHHNLDHITGVEVDGDKSCVFGVLYRLYRKLAVSTSASDCSQRLVSKMTYYYSV